MQRDTIFVFVFPWKILKITKAFSNEFPYNTNVRIKSGIINKMQPEIVIGTRLRVK